MSSVTQFDLSTHGRLRLVGPDRVRFLHGMVTNDIEKLAIGQGCHAAMLTTRGKMLADLVVYADEDALFIELDASVRDKIRDVIAKHIIMDDCEISDVTDETDAIGVYGDGAAALLSTIVDQDVSNLSHYAHVSAKGVRVARTPELGVVGFHVIASKGAMPTIDAPVMSAEAREVLRIEAGTPIYGVDMGEDRLPIEANIADAVSFDKGCYLGQEVIARATNLGHINKKLVGFTVDANAPTTLPAGAKISTAERPEAGVVTSAVFSPRLGKTIALGYLHRTLWAPGTTVQIDAGQGAIANARVVELPFLK